MHNLTVYSMLSIILYVDRPICELKRHAEQRRKKNRKEKNISIKDNTLRFFDYNNTLEIFSFLECSNHRRSHEVSCAIDE